METEKQEAIDYIDMRAELLGVIQVFQGCGNGASLGNLLPRFPLFPQASSSYFLF